MSCSVKYNRTGSLVVVGLLPCSKSSDLLRNTLLALSVSETSLLVLERFGLPVRGLFCGLEDGIFSDSSVCVGIDLLDIFGTDSIGEVC